METYKTGKLQPGQLCMIVKSSFPEKLGKVVTLVEYVDRIPEEFLYDLFNEGDHFKESYKGGYWKVDTNLKIGFRGKKGEKRLFEFRFIPFANEADIMPIDGLEEHEDFKETEKPISA